MCTSWQDRSMNSGIPQCLQHTVVWTFTGTGKRTPHSIPQNRFGLYDTARFSSSGIPLPLLKNACTLSLKREHRERKRMEIRKPGAAELKPALALAWDVFLKDAASGFSTRASEHSNASSNTTAWRQRWPTGQRRCGPRFPALSLTASSPQGKAISACSSSPALIKGME